MNIWITWASCSNADPDSVGQVGGRDSFAARSLVTPSLVTPLALTPHPEQQILKQRDATYLLCLVQACVLLPSSCPTLCDPLGHGLLGSSIHGVLQLNAWHPFRCFDFLGLECGSGICAFTQDCTLRNAAQECLFPMLTTEGCES